MMQHFVAWSGQPVEFTHAVDASSPGAVVREYLAKIAIDVPADAWLVLDEIRPSGAMVVRFCWLGYSGVVRESPAVFLRLCARP